MKYVKLVESVLTEGKKVKFKKHGDGYQTVVDIAMDGKKVKMRVSLYNNYGTWTYSITSDVFDMKYNNAVNDGVANTKWQAVEEIQSIVDGGLKKSYWGWVTD